MQDLIADALRAMNWILNHLPERANVEQKGESGAMIGDEELVADIVLGEKAREVLSAHRDIRYVTVEGFGTTTAHPKGKYDAFVDPLDASLNLKNRGDVTFFPYGGVITIVEAIESPRFANIVAAGVMNFSNQAGDMWLVEMNGRTSINGTSAYPYQGELKLTKTAVIAEMYYSENRIKVVKAFAGLDGYLRSPGCAAVEMACVSSGQAAAFICDRQKAHELGAAYLLVKNAGGKVTDWEGLDLAEKVYDFKAKYDVIVAADAKASDWILGLVSNWGA